MPASAAARRSATHDIADPKLADAGKARILWAEAQMPVLGAIRERFEQSKPFKGLRISACLHITSETANLLRALAAGGAEVLCCASNPLSTQDDVAASLVRHFGISTHCRRGEDRDAYYKHLVTALAFHPHITMDDGADLVTLLHQEHAGQIGEILGSMEETTTGVIRLKAMARDGALKLPVMAVNDADCKHLFDNRYGTGQSTVDGILRATNVLFAGKRVVVAGYGWCGRGFAARARGMGALVIVCEVDPVRALEAAMDGFEVMPMQKAAREGDIFCTLTGDAAVLGAGHFKAMKDGAILANSGHFNVEIDIPALARQARKVDRNVRPGVDAYRMGDGRSLYLLGEGRLVNLTMAEGHPAAVMDMSFAVQALCSAHVATLDRRLEPGVHAVPKAIDAEVARLKLTSMGIAIDRLTPEQTCYLSSWQEGT
jgi:adenosylhomocysteinase